MAMWRGAAFIAALIGGVIALAIGVYFRFEYKYTTFQISSMSPDGLYTCEVIEKANGSQSEAFVTIRSRLNGTGGAGWRIDFEDHIDNDSVSREPYSITWRPAAPGSTPAVEVVDVRGDLSPRLYELNQGRWQRQRITSAQSSGAAQ
jgi:hypothetical protein